MAMKALLIPVILTIFFSVYEITTREANAASLQGVTTKMDKKLQEQIDLMIKQRGKDYKPRTRHLLPDGKPKYTNRLFLESSPYLLQHAHNPVNWYPWGEEAFETARKLNRPVLLSVGYSTCHWCHVMEEESFEDEQIADYLNSHYIAIKVDREERPDIDAIYMTAVQALTGSGGWPLNVWLTPDRKPFFGGTYFPAKDGDRGVKMGFITVLERLNDTYKTKRDSVEESGQALVNAIRQYMTSETGKDIPSVDVMHKAAETYKQGFDPVNGGIKGAPKFPSSLPVRFLLRYWRRTGDQATLNMALKSLTKMANGGMYDQIGGGFHRYSTDEKWLVPHFEKMLYDNALLVPAFLEGFQAAGDKKFEKVVRHILRYVKREMTSPDGAFYSATDADSINPKGHMDEGYFFTWTPKEIKEALDKDQAEAVIQYYGVSETGNFEGRSILNVAREAGLVAQNLKINEKDLEEMIEKANDRLYELRSNRPKPLRDEKILTAWNGLMISAYAMSGLILNEPEYINQAENAARFILAELFKDNRLYRSYKDGKARHNAYIQDYAFFIASLIDLYEASHDIKWLKKAIELDAIIEEKFEDRENGGFFMTSHDHEALIARQKPNSDGAVPGGNSVAVLNLFRLAEYTTKDEYAKRGRNALKAFSNILVSSPTALSEMLPALDFFLDTPKEIVIVTPKGQITTAAEWSKAFRSQFLPNRVFILAEEGSNLEKQAELIPFISGKTALKGDITAYICEKGSCKFPSETPKDFLREIQAIKKLEPAGKQDM
ncbi:thioredoxin domain-containing protein [Desulfobacterales bacterium HSG16]|nr:thioredoxin domain-containing protein [Desulfobacterales bacterium HSG16]